MNEQGKTLPPLAENTDRGPVWVSQEIAASRGKQQGDPRQDCVSSPVFYCYSSFFSFSKTAKKYTQQQQQNQQSQEDTQPGHRGDVTTSL